MTDTFTPAETPGNAEIHGKPLRRRHLGTLPGDALLMPSGDSTAYTQVFHDFLRATEVPPSMLNPSRLCMVPIPTHTYREELGEQPVSNWANPMFWLPKQWRVNEAGATDDLMGLRLTWELTLSGLYDPQEGFADILYAHGIDVDTEEGAKRVSDWLAGGSDAVLDGIDVTELMARPDDEEDDWIQILAYEALPGVLQAVWGLNANSFLDLLTGAVEEYSEDEDAAALDRALIALLTMGSVIFEDIVYDEVESSEALAALADHVAENPQQRIGAAIVFRDLLRYIAEANADAVEEYVAEVSAEPDQADATDADELPGFGDGEQDRL